MYSWDTYLVGLDHSVFWTRLTVAELWIVSTAQRHQNHGCESEQQLLHSDWLWGTLSDAAGLRYSSGLPTLPDYQVMQLLPRSSSPYETDNFTRIQLIFVLKIHLFRQNCMSVRVHLYIYFKSDDFRSRLQNIFAFAKQSLFAIFQKSPLLLQIFSQTQKRS